MQRGEGHHSRVGVWGDITITEALSKWIVVNLQLSEVGVLVGGDSDEFGGLKSDDCFFLV